jgi:hypothetical protein
MKYIIHQANTLENVKLNIPQHMNQYQLDKALKKLTIQKT